MKKLLRVALAIAALAWVPGLRAETADPPPIQSEDAPLADSRQLVGLFDLGFGSDGNCPNGVCLTPRRVASASPATVAVASAACESAATGRRFRPVVNTIRAVRSWYPGKAIQTIRAARQTGRCR